MQTGRDMRSICCSYLALLLALETLVGVSVKGFFILPVDFDGPNDIHKQVGAKN